MTGKVFCIGNGEAIEEKVQRPLANLEGQVSEGAWPEVLIRENLQGIKYAE